MRRLVLLVPLVAALLAPLAFGRLAPAAAQRDYPVTPDPADCAVAPRDPDDLLALWYDDGTLIASPAAEDAPAEATIPLGEPADADTVAAIEETVLAVFGCFAAGDFLRATAYFTDDLAANYGPEPGTPEDDARAFLEADPEPEGNEGRILAITDVMALGDGRVGAFVVEETGGDPPFSSYVLFVEEDGAWLVDELIEFSAPPEEGEGADATPAAAADTARADEADAAGAAVTMARSAFKPAELVIAAGTTVTWTNNDFAAHTATADDGTFDSGHLAFGADFSYTFDEPGTYHYFCRPHPRMTGTIVVE